MTVIAFIATFGVSALLGYHYASSYWHSRMHDLLARAARQSWHDPRDGETAIGLAVLAQIAGTPPPRGALLWGPRRHDCDPEDEP